MVVVDFIKKNVKGDKMIWAVVLLLFFWSSVVIYSATGSLAWRKDMAENHFFISHASKYVIGFIIIFIFHRINYVKYKKWASYMFLLSIPLLILTLSGVGTSLNEGARWLTIPIINVTFQTSDFAKLAIFMYLAKMLSLRQDDIKQFWKGFFWPILSPVLIITILIGVANLSTALLLLLTCSIMFFIGRVSTKHILALAFMGAVAVMGMYGVSKLTGKGRAETWEKRIETFLGNGDADDNFQVTQAKIAIANGKILGKGPSNSWARDYLPHPYSDMIYAMLIEEYGIVGGIALMLIYLTLLWRSIQIFRRIPYAFGAFLVIALSVTMVFQAFVNMGVAVNLLPVTGLTLPLMSMGGSSIWFNCIAIGIILSVSRYVEDADARNVVNKNDTTEEQIHQLEIAKV
jgi:cell division protein FtsW